MYTRCTDIYTQKNEQDLSGHLQSPGYQSILTGHLMSYLVLSNSKVETMVPAMMLNIFETRYC